MWFVPQCLGEKRLHSSRSQRVLGGFLASLGCVFFVRDPQNGFWLPFGFPFRPPQNGYNHTHTHRVPKLLDVQTLWWGAFPGAR